MGLKMAKALDVLLRKFELDEKSTERKMTPEEAKKFDDLMFEITKISAE